MGRNVVIASGTFITCEKHAGIAILRTVYTCNFCHVQYLLRLSCSFNRVCKQAAISVTFCHDIAGVSNIF